MFFVWDKVLYMFVGIFIMSVCVCTEFMMMECCIKREALLFGFGSSTDGLRIYAIVGYRHTHLTCNRFSFVWIVRNGIQMLWYIEVDFVSH